MKELLLLEMIAEENSLELIETTTGRNGYPQNLRYAIIGFETFEEAKELAEKHGLRITTFYKRDGWQLYQRDNNTTWQPLRITSYDYGDGYHHFTNGISQEDFVEEFLLPNISATTFDDIKKIIQVYEELFNKISEAEDDEIVIACFFEYVETIKKELMSWSHDSKTWVIGVINDD